MKTYCKLLALFYALDHYIKWSNSFTIQPPIALRYKCHTKQIKTKNAQPLANTLSHMGRTNLKTLSSESDPCSSALGRDDSALPNLENMEKSPLFFAEIKAAPKKTNSSPNTDNNISKKFAVAWQSIAINDKTVSAIFIGTIENIEKGLAALKTAAGGSVKSNAISISEKAGDFIDKSISAFDILDGLEDNTMTLEDARVSMTTRPASMKKTVVMKKPSLSSRAVSSAQDNDSSGPKKTEDILDVPFYFSKLANDTQSSVNRIGVSSSAPAIRSSNLPNITANDAVIVKKKVSIFGVPYTQNRPPTLKDTNSSATVLSFPNDNKSMSDKSTPDETRNGSSLSKKELLTSKESQDLPSNTSSAPAEKVRIKVDNDSLVKSMSESTKVQEMLQEPLSVQAKTDQPTLDSGISINDVPKSKEMKDLSGNVSSTPDMLNKPSPMTAAKAEPEVNSSIPIKDMLAPKKSQDISNKSRLVPSKTDQPKLDGSISMKNESKSNELKGLSDDLSSIKQTLGLSKEPSTMPAAQISRPKVEGGIGMKDVLTYKKNQDIAKQSSPVPAVKTGRLNADTVAPMKSAPKKTPDMPKKTSPVPESKNNDMPKVNSSISMKDVSKQLNELKDLSNDLSSIRQTLYMSNKSPTTQAAKPDKPKVDSSSGTKSVQTSRNIQGKSRSSPKSPAKPDKLKADSGIGMKDWLASKKAPGIVDKPSSDPAAKPDRPKVDESKNMSAFKSFPVASAEPDKPELDKNISIEIIPKPKQMKDLPDKSFNSGKTPDMLKNPSPAAAKTDKSRVDGNVPAENLPALKKTQDILSASKPDKPNLEPSISMKNMPKSKKNQDMLNKKPPAIVDSSIPVKNTPEFKETRDPVIAKADISKKESDILMKNMPKSNKTQDMKSKPFPVPTAKIDKDRLDSGNPIKNVSKPKEKKDLSGNSFLSMKSQGTLKDKPSTVPSVETNRPKVDSGSVINNSSTSKKTPDMLKNLYPVASAKTDSPTADTNTRRKDVIISKETKDPPENSLLSKRTPEVMNPQFPVPSKTDKPRLDTSISMQDRLALKKTQQMIKKPSNMPATETDKLKVDASTPMKDTLASTQNEGVKKSSPVKAKIDKVKVDSSNPIKKASQRKDVKGLSENSLSKKTRDMMEKPSPVPVGKVDSGTQIKNITKSKESEDSSRYSSSAKLHEVSLDSNVSASAKAKPKSQETEVILDRSFPVQFKKEKTKADTDNSVIDASISEEAKEMLDRSFSVPVNKGKSKEDTIVPRGNISVGISDKPAQTQSQEDLTNAAYNITAKLDKTAKNILVKSPPAEVQEDNIEIYREPMYSFHDGAETVEVFLETDGGPQNSYIEIQWSGSDSIYQKMYAFVEPGCLQPFSCIVETPAARNAVAIRNTDPRDFPQDITIDPNTENGAAEKLYYTKTPKIISGGNFYLSDFDPSVSGVQVLFSTDGASVNARIEIAQGQSNKIQMVDVYTKDGFVRPFFAVFDTPGSGNTVKVTNKDFEYPLYVIVAPTTAWHLNSF